MSIIIYDTEIVNAIPSPREERINSLQYCGGWTDFKNMGISVLVAMELGTRYPRVFHEDNLQSALSMFLDAELIVGFNQVKFDNALVAANLEGPMGTDLKAILDAKSYDILREAWSASNLNPDEFGRSHWGFGLHDLSMLNLGRGKTGEGGKWAPLHWQQGKRGTVTQYCIDDVMLTLDLLDHIRFGNALETKNGPVQPWIHPALRGDTDTDIQF